MRRDKAGKEKIAPGPKAISNPGAPAPWTIATGSLPGRGRFKHLGGAGADNEVAEQGAKHLGHSHSLIMGRGFEGLCLPTRQQNCQFNHFLFTKGRHVVLSLTPRETGNTHGIPRRKNENVMDQLPCRSRESLGEEVLRLANNLGK